MADAFGWLFGILPYAIVIVIVVVLALRFLAVFSDYLPFLARRRVRVKQNVRDYFGEFILDIKRGAVRNKTPAKILHVRDVKDPEFPYLHYGKIKGINADSDFYEIVVSRKLGIMSDVLFIDRDLVTDLQSKDLYAECHGWKPKARYFFFPIRGSSMPRPEQEKRDRALALHIATEFDLFRNLIVIEQGTANLEKSMTSNARDVMERLLGPEYQTSPPVQGQEEIH